MHTVRPWKSAYSEALIMHKHAALSSLSQMPLYYEPILTNIFSGRGKKKELITCREWQEYIYFNNSLFSIPGICLHLKIGWSSPQGWEGAARQPACSRLLLAQGWLPRHCKQSSGAAQSLYFPSSSPEVKCYQ